MGDVPSGVEKEVQSSRFDGDALLTKGEAQWAELLFTYCLMLLGR